MVVEEVFVRAGLIWHLHVVGQVIRTTAEHPFYVQDRGWRACQALRVTDTQRAVVERKYAKANELLASGDEVAHVPAAGPVRNDRNASRRFIRDTDAPVDPATGRLVPMSKIKNPPGVQVDEYVGVAWGGKSRIENQHYLDTSTNLALGGKDKAVFQKLRDEGLTGVRVREFRLIFDE